MAGLNVYQDSYIGATIISNRFIDEYMTEANDAQLKVYLYLVRMLNAHLETGVSDIADRFNHTEKDVLRAFNYWAKKGLLTLDYDDNGELVGVHLINLCKEDPKGPSVESTHRKLKPQTAKSTIAAKAESVNAEAVNAESVNATAVNVEAVNAEFAKAESAGPVNRADNANAESAGSANRADNANAESAGSANRADNAKAESAGSANRADNATVAEVGKVPCRKSSSHANPDSTILFLAEMYYSRPLSKTDVDILGFVEDELGFSDDLIDYLLQYCAEKKKDFRYLEKVAIGWKENGITTVAQASGSNLKHEKIVYEIMNRLGKSGTPADAEMEYISRWIREYGFEDSTILAACDKTTLSTDSHRFQYCDGILSNWFKNNIRTLADIEAQNEEHRKNRENNAEAASANGSIGSGVGGARKNGSGKKPTGGGNSGAFGNFEQRDIDFAALEKKLFIN